LLFTTYSLMTDINEAGSASATWLPYVLLIVALVAAELFWKKNLIRAVMEAQIQLPQQVWRHLNHAWAAFFGVLGAINLYVAFHFSTSTWVNFKLFGTMALMLVFVVIQGILLEKYVKESK
jgi:intracellular septation protein